MRRLRGARRGTVKDRPRLPMIKAMTVATRTRSEDNLTGGDSSSGTEPELVGRGRRATLHWRPGVRMVLILVVMLPMLSTAVLALTRLTSGWTFREQAKLVADDAARLQMVAAARAQLNELRP